MRWARAFALSALPMCLGAIATACAPQYPASGLPGRSSDIEFSNRASAGRHEYWAPATARMTMFAAFAQETDEYGHGILGATRDAKALTIHVARVGSDKISCPAEVALPEGHVFEDVAPILADMNGDGLPEVLVVQSSVAKGARLAVYDRRAQLVAATPYIGRTHRWLAPIGVADLDGNGDMEVAYIDRPHLAKTLRIWRYRNRGLTEVANMPGLTNHKIGWAHIPGGIRSCADQPEIIAAGGDWARIFAVTLTRGKIRTRDIGPYTGPNSLNAALTCP